MISSLPLISCFFCLAIFPNPSSCSINQPEPTGEVGAGSKSKETKSSTNFSQIDFTGLRASLGELTKAEYTYGNRSVVYKPVMWRRTGRTYAVVATVGRRKYMQDRFAVLSGANNPNFTIYAIFDGHGGEQVADLAESELPMRVARQIHANPGILDQEEKLASLLVKEFKDFDRDLEPRITDRSGSTALMGIVQGTKLTVASVGDSRGIIYYRSALIPVVQLNTEHKPNGRSERERIESLGGQITHYANDAVRVEGNLALSRALGDFQLKKYVIPDPEVTTHDLKDAEYFLLATDGLYGVYSNENVGRIIKNRMQQPDLGVKRLVKKSNTFSDNVAVIAVKM